MKSSSTRTKFAVIGLLVGLGAVGCRQSADSLPGPSTSASRALPAPISLAKFEETISQDKLVLVKFGATWCGPCIKVDAELEKIQAALGDKVDVLKVDIDANRDLAEQYEIGPIPRMFLVRNGEVVTDQLGYSSADELTDWINQYR